MTVKFSRDKSNDIDINDHNDSARFETFFKVEVPYIL